MSKGVALFLFCVVFAGCNGSQPAGTASKDVVPDYHDLLGDKNKAALELARDKCSEAKSSQERDASRWCYVYNKAQACNGYMRVAPDAPTPNMVCPEK
jgi:hypothetical protein